MKDESGTFLRNVTSLTTANFLARAVGALVSILVMNHLGDMRYGFFKAAMSFATIILIFAETGVGMRFVYDCSGDKSKIREHFGAALMLQVLPYLAACLVAAFVAPIFFSSPSERVVITIVVIVSAAAVLRVLAETCEKVMNVYREMHLKALLRAGRFVAIAIGGVIVVWADLGPVAWALVTLFSMGAAAVVSFAIALSFVKPKFVKSMLWPTLRASYIFGAGAVCFAIYDQVDQFMLSQFGPTAKAFRAVGVYGAAYVLISFTYTIPSSFVASMEPVAFAARGDFARLTKLATLSVRAIGALGVPLALGVFLFADRIQALVLPAFGADAAVALRILALFAGLRFVDFPAGMLMAAGGMQGRRVAIQVAALVLNVCANFLLIPSYGFAGAAWATVATEVLILVLYNVSLVRKLDGFRGPLVLGKPAVAAAVMGLFIWGLQRVGAPLIDGNRFAWLVIVPLAAGIYFGCLMMTKYVKEDEAAVIRRFVAKFAFWRRNNAG